MYATFLIDFRDATGKTKMGKRKIPFKTNVDQSVDRSVWLPKTEEGRLRRKKRAAGLEGGKKKSLKATKVNPGKERLNRFLWVLKWILVLPLAFYGLTWIVIIMLDLFKS